MNKPLIIVGMHRSGTSVLSRLLEEHGVFLGWMRDHNNESRFHMEANNWLLAELGGSWENPVSVACLDERYFELLAGRLLKIVRGPLSLVFKGPGRLGENLAGGLPGPWGWKDPRTSITLPLWLSLYPDARVLHIARNPIDVALSLSRREKERFEKYRARYRRLPSIWLRPPSRYSAARLMDVRAGLRLWSRYLDDIASHREAVNPTHWLDVRYEDLLADPGGSLERVFDFAGIPADSRNLSAAGQLNADRRFGFRQDPGSLTLYREFCSREHLARYGYENLEEVLEQP